MSVMIDYGPSIAEIMERRVDTLASKREAAVKWLGKKYVLHKANRIAKLAEPLPDFGRPNGGARK